MCEKIHKELNKKQQRAHYLHNQIVALTDGGVYGYKIQILSGANSIGTHWIDIDKNELNQIDTILSSFEVENDIPKQHPVCPECGETDSENFVFDASAQWDNEQQKFILNEVLDRQCTCLVCDTHFDQPEWNTYS
jgi:hypothetical protein